MNIPVKSIAISALLTLAVGLSMLAFAQNANPSAVPSLAGSSWTVTETDGDNDIFDFWADGTLHYSYQNGTTRTAHGSRMEMRST